MVLIIHEKGETMKKISFAGKDQEFRDLLVAARNFWEKKVKKTKFRSYKDHDYLKGLCMKHILRELLEAN